MTRKYKILFCCLFIITISVAVIFLLRNKKDIGRNICINEVTNYLKAPSTANFTKTSEKDMGLSYIIKGAVDSENSFGAKIRTNFECFMNRIDNKPELVEVNFDNN